MQKIKNSLDTPLASSKPLASSYCSAYSPLALSSFAINPVEVQGMSAALCSTAFWWVGRGVLGS